MENSPVPKEYQVLYIIVNYGLASKIIKYAKERSLTTGGTVIPGIGTIKNRLLELLGLTEIRKEIVLMVTERAKAARALEEIGQKFKFNKPHTGIGFSIAAKEFWGGHNHSYGNTEESRGGEDSMYDAIFVVVDRGKAELVIDAATKAGSGERYHARSSGIHETANSCEIEPEKNGFNPEKTDGAHCLKHQEELHITSRAKASFYPGRR